MTTKKIVLTGGPSSGKTLIAKEASELFGEQVRLVPESASILYTNGFPRYEDDQSRVLQQKTIYVVQKNMEKLLVRNSQKDWLLCDRGSLDGLAYWPQDQSSYFSQVGSSFIGELNSYEHVIFLQSPAKEYYEHNHVRRENFQQALGLEKLLFDIWSNHHNFHHIPRTDSFEEKEKQVIGLIKSLIQ